MPGIKGLFNFAERGIIRTEGLKIKSGKLKLRIRGRSPAGRAQSGCSGTSPGCPSAGDGDVTGGAAASHPEWMRSWAAAGAVWWQQRAKGLNLLPGHILTSRCLGWSLGAQR